MLQFANDNFRDKLNNKSDFQKKFDQFSDGGRLFCQNYIFATGQ